MNTKVKREVSMCTLLIIALTATLLFAPNAMADTGELKVSVNINTADAGEFVSLPGIGEQKASAIVSYRAEHGPFTSIEDLSLVRGIGPGVMDKIRDLLRIE